MAKHCRAAYHATGEHGENLGWFCSTPGALIPVTMADCTGCPYREPYQEPARNPRIRDYIDAGAALLAEYMDRWGEPPTKADLVP